LIDWADVARGGRAPPCAYRAGRRAEPARTAQAESRGKVMKEMDARCIDHARIAARHVKMKSLDPTKAGLAFVAEGLMMIYSIDRETADFLSITYCSQACNTLLDRTLEKARLAGATESEMATLLEQAAEARRKLPIRT
jgi:hypothetical protein